MCWTKEAMNGDVCEYGDTHEEEGAPLQLLEPTLTADWVQQAEPAMADMPLAVSPFPTSDCWSSALNSVEKMVRWIIFCDFL
jgi:hypothetical protein